MALHDVRFPGESAAYRAARDELLKAELELRDHVERLAEARRKLPLGGEVPEDYVFDEGERKVRLSELFATGKDTLLLYSFMYGPDRERPCPMCTSFLDALDGNVDHIVQRANLAVVGKSPIRRLRDFARERGWTRLRMLSSFENGYNRAYHGEDEHGKQLPAMNVFVRRDGVIRHFYNSEVLYVPNETGQDQRHIDAMWPLWNVLDLTPEGRGTDWYPSLDCVKAG